MRGLVLVVIAVVGVGVLLAEVAALVALVELLLPVAAVLVLHPEVVVGANYQASVPAIRTRTSRTIILARATRLALIQDMVAIIQERGMTNKALRR